VELPNEPGTWRNVQETPVDAAVTKSLTFLLLLL